MGQFYLSERTNNGKYHVLMPLAENHGKSLCKENIHLEKLKEINNKYECRDFKLCESCKELMEESQSYNMHESEQRMYRRNI